MAKTELDLRLETFQDALDAAIYDAVAGGVYRGALEVLLRNAASQLAQDRLRVEAEMLVKGA